MSSPTESRPTTAKGQPAISTSTSLNNSSTTSSSPCRRKNSAKNTASTLSSSASSTTRDAEILWALPRPPPYQEIFPPPTDDPIDYYLEKFADAYNISITLTERLRKLQEFEIVILIDDSGSMNTLNKVTRRTRWNDLKEMVKIIVYIGTVFDTNGVDVYSFHQPPMLDVTNPDDIDKMFSRRPFGFTPLATALKYIFKLDKAKPGGDKSLLVFVATDAEPNNQNDKIDLLSVEKVMRDVRQEDTTHVMFILCSDKPECRDYLSKWDETMPNVDFTQDFESEKKEVHKHHGTDYPFSFGDYIVKTLLGAVDPDMDALNEPRATQFTDD